MKPIKRLIRLWLATTFIILNGCAATTDKPEVTAPPVYTLEDTDWQLQAFLQGSAQTSGKATLRLRSDTRRIAGSAGCNRYFGSYRMNGEQITFSQMGATKMMCQNMAEEDHFFKYMMRSNRYQIENDQLILFKDNRPLMQFKATSAPKKQQATQSVKIEGTVTHVERRLLTGNLVLKVVLEDISRMDVAAETIARFEQPIKSQIPLKFELNYDPKVLKPGHRYNLRARIENTDNGKLEWLTTEPYPYIPNITKNIELQVRSIGKAQKVAAQQLRYQCGNSKVEVLLIGKDTIKLTQGGRKWILKQTPSASGSKYQNSQISFWMKGKSAHLEPKGEDGVNCQQLSAK